MKEKLVSLAALNKHKKQNIWRSADVYLTNCGTTSIIFRFSKKLLVKTGWTRRTRIDVLSAKGHLFFRTSKTGWKLFGVGDKNARLQIKIRRYATTPIPKLTAPVSLKVIAIKRLKGTVEVVGF